MFDGILLKVASILAVIFLCISLLTTYLYLGTRDELIELETHYAQLQQDLKESQESKSKVVEGIAQDDALIVDKDTTISTLEDEKDALLKKLNIPSKQRKCTPPVNDTKNEIINPSNSWDADTQQLLNEAYESNKRDSNPTP